MCQKLHCPIDNRDQLYQKSGCNGFQFKQVREPSDPPEKGLEVMKVQFDGPISKAHEQCGSMGGFLGVFRSKSATYVRIANDNIKEARSILYKNDPRFTAFNANAKAGDLYKIQGFQAGVQIAEVVRVTETIKWPCIPMRVVNSQDLAVVYVTAATQPSHFRYPTSMGVLMISPVMTVRSAKSSGSSSSTSAPSTARSQIDSMKESKRKSEPKKAAKPMSETKTTSAPSYSQVLQNSDLEKRVSVLEGQMQNVQTKVQIIDQKCTDISSNMSAGFDKLMAAIQTMQAQSADTPVQSPIPKHQKTQK